ncbi:hypothetical protein RHS01_01656 [Rhizoctonia solani]|uniref:Uncharacterized protein n=1 Tax=Rhizoctonia solani TaxID=456999 RepID=A0A8H7IKQ2_9AGAM|nr:hypothetical protein RHS01_01656 [Rhizoctonia solani]
MGCTTTKVIAAPLDVHTDWVWSVGFSPDGALLVSGSNDCTVHMVYSVVFSPDGNRIVSGSGDKTIRIWDVQSGETVVGPLEGHSDSVWSISISPDGSRIASGSRDFTVRVWDSQTGAMIAGPFQGHFSPVFSVSFSPDGNRIMSGAQNGVVYMWEAHTGVMILNLAGANSAVTFVAFSPEGKRIVYGCGNGTVVVHSLIESPLKGEEVPEGTLEILAAGHMSNNEAFDQMMLHGCTDMRPTIDPEGYRMDPLVQADSATFGKDHVMQEVCSRFQVKHENIQELLGVTMFQGRLGVVSPWMPYSGLQEYIQKSPDVDRYGLANILVSTDGTLKISNFNYSILAESATVISHTANLGGGSLRWMAPELLPSADDDLERVVKRTKQSDVYALGMTLLEIITGRVPYSECETDHGVFVTLEKRERPVRPKELLGDDVKQGTMWKLMLWCWDFEPSARPAVDYVLIMTNNYPTFGEVTPILPNLYLSSLSALQTCLAQSSLPITHILSILDAPVDLPGFTGSRLVIVTLGQRRVGSAVPTGRVRRVRAERETRGGTVVVHCLMGLSRSVCVVAATIRPNPGLVKQLESWCSARTAVIPVHLDGHVLYLWGAVGTRCSYGTDGGKRKECMRLPRLGRGTEDGHEVVTRNDVGIGRAEYKRQQKKWENWPNKEGGVRSPGGAYIGPGPGALGLDVASGSLRESAGSEESGSESEWEEEGIAWPSPPNEKTLCAMVEMRDSEEKFVGLVERLVQVYLPKLPPVLTASATALLGRNAAMVLDLHRRIATELKANQASRVGLCHVLSSYAPELTSLHQEFSAGHSAAKALLNRAQAKDPVLWSQWERERADESGPEPDGSRPRSLEDLLIAPIQRVCRYHLVAGLRDGTEEPHVTDAVLAMQAVAASVDEIVRVRADEDRTKVVLDRMDPIPNLPAGYLASLGPCLLIGTLDVIYYEAPTKPPLVTANSHSSQLTVTSSAASTLSSPPSALVSGKPQKAKHLAAFLWTGYLVLCKVHTKRVRYEPKRWFPLKIVPPNSITLHPNPSVIDSGQSPRRPPAATATAPAQQQLALPVIQQLQNKKSYGHIRTKSHSQAQVQTPTQSTLDEQPPTLGLGHVQVQPSDQVFPYGIRINFSRHVFELGASCEEERDIWVRELVAARVGNELVLASDKDKDRGRGVTRSKSAGAVAPSEDTSKALVRGWSDGASTRTREKSLERGALASRERGGAFSDSEAGNRAGTRTTARLYETTGPRLPPEKTNPSRPIRPRKTSTPAEKIDRGARTAPCRSGIGSSSGSRRCPRPAGALLLPPAPMPQSERVAGTKRERGHRLGDIRKPPRTELVLEPPLVFEPPRAHLVLEPPHAPAPEPHSSLVLLEPAHTRHLLEPALPPASSSSIHSSPPSSFPAERLLPHITGSSTWHTSSEGTGIGERLENVFLRPRYGHGHSHGYGYGYAAAAAPSPHPQGSYAQPGYVGPGGQASYAAQRTAGVHFTQRTIRRAGWWRSSSSSTYSTPSTVTPTSYPRSEAPSGYARSEAPSAYARSEAHSNYARSEANSSYARSEGHGAPSNYSRSEAPSNYAPSSYPRSDYAPSINAPSSSSSSTPYGSQVSTPAGHGPNFATSSYAPRFQTRSRANESTLAANVERAFGVAPANGVGADVHRTNSSSTDRSRSFPPSPVTTAQPTLPAPVQPAAPQQQPLAPQPFVRRPSNNTRDPVIMALSDVISSTCREARDRASVKRKPLWITPEEASAAAEKEKEKACERMMGQGQGRQGKGVGKGQGKGEQGGGKGKEKGGSVARPSSSEGVGSSVNPDKTPLQRKRATIHGAMHAFPSMGPPSPEHEPQSLSVHGHGTPSSQVTLTPSAQQQQQHSQPPVQQQQQPPPRPPSMHARKASDGPISPPRSRTVSSSGSFVDGMRDFLLLRRAFAKSAENMALSAPSHDPPNPIYTVGAGLTNTKSEEGLPRTKSKSGSVPVPGQDSELYSLGAGITNAGAPPQPKRKPRISLRSSSAGSAFFAQLTGKRKSSKNNAAPLSTLTFTPMSEKDKAEYQANQRARESRSRSNEYYRRITPNQGQQQAGPPNRNMLGAELYSSPSSMRLQPSPVAEESAKFIEEGDEGVYAGYR